MKPEAPGVAILMLTRALEAAKAADYLIAREELDSGGSVVRKLLIATRGWARDLVDFLDKELA